MKTLQKTISIYAKKGSMKNLDKFIDNVNGKVGIPILLYLLGVPGVVVVFLWLFFFRDR